MRITTFVKLSAAIVLVLLIGLSGFSHIEGQAMLATGSATSTAILGTAVVSPTVAKLPPTATPLGTMPPTSAATVSPTPTSVAPTNIPPTVPPTATLAPAVVATTPAQSAQCTPTEVTVFVKSPRIHVKCAQPTNGIIYFAVPTTDAALAQRVLMLFTTAVTDKKALLITYDDTDTSGAAIGCLSKDCRLIVEVTLIP